MVGLRSTLLFLFVILPAQCRCDIRWTLWPKDVKTMNTSSLLWYGKNTENKNTLYITVGNQTIREIAYTDSSVVSGFLILNITDEGRHEVHFNVLNENCDQVNDECSSEWKNSSLFINSYGDIDSSLVFVEPGEKDILVPFGNTSLKYGFNFPSPPTFDDNYELNAQVFWTEATSGEAVNVTTEGGDFVTEPLNYGNDFTVEHQQIFFDKPGTYNGTVEFGNPVTKAYSTVQIRVESRPEVMNVIVTSSESPSNSDTVITTPSSDVNVWATPSRGIVTKWHLEVTEDASVTGKQPPFVVSFEKEGDYDITLSFDSTEGSSFPITRRVIVRESVSKMLVMAEPQTVRPGFKIGVGVFTLMAQGSCLTLSIEGGTSIVGWKNGEVCDVEPTEEVDWLPISATTEFITYTYTPSEPLKDLTVVATHYSLFGNHSESTSTLAIGADVCNELSAVIVESYNHSHPLKLQKHEMLSLSADFTSDCEEGTTIDIFWLVEPAIQNNEDPLRIELKDLAGNHSQPSVSNIYFLAEENKKAYKLPDFVDTSSETLSIPPHVLPAGLFNVKVFMNVTKQVGSSLHWSCQSSSSSVEMSSSDMTISLIRGGGNGPIRRGRLYFNASLFSHDPDDPLGKIGKFSWYCRREDEPWTEGMLSNIGSKKGNGGCFGGGPGEIPPPHSNGEILDVSNKLFTNIPKKYIIGVRALATDGVKFTDIDTIVEVVPGDPPVLIGGCVPASACRVLEGGRLFANPGARLLLQADCEPMPWVTPEEGSNCSPGVLYSWKFDGILTAGSDEKEALPVLETNTTSDLSQRTVALMESFWTTFSRYREFIVTIEGVKPGEEYSGKVVLHLVVNLPPVDGRCEIQRNGENEHGPITALVQTVDILCDGWTDPEQEGIDKYIYYGLTEANKKLPLSFGKENRSSVILPYGLNNSLWVEVFDRGGASVKALVDYVDMELPTVEQFEKYEASGQMDAAVDGKDTILVGQLLQSELSLKGRKLRGEPEGPVSEKELAAQKKKALGKNKKMVSSIGNFDTKSVDDIVQVTGILSAVAYPLPADAEDSAIQSMVSLSDSVSSTASLAQTQDMAQSTAGTVGSLLKGVNENVASTNDSKPLAEYISIIEDCADDPNCSGQCSTCLENRTISDGGIESEETLFDDYEVSNTSDSSYADTSDYNVSSLSSSGKLSTASPYLSQFHSSDEVLVVILESGSSCDTLEALRCIKDYLGDEKMVEMYKVTDMFNDLPTDEENCTIYLDDIEMLDESAGKANGKVDLAMSAVESVQGPLMSASLLGEPNAVDGEGVNMAVGMFDARELAGRSVMVGDAEYIFPSYCAVINEDEDCLPEGVQVTLGIKMANWKDQIYSFGGNKDTLSDGSATVQLSLVDANMKAIPVNESREDFILKIPIAQDQIEEPTFIADLGPNRTQLINVHSFTPRNDRVGVFIEIKPNNSEIFENVTIYDESHSIWIVTFSTAKPSNESIPEVYFILQDTFSYNIDTGFYELFMNSSTLSSLLPSEVAIEETDSQDYFLGLAKVNFTALREQFQLTDQDTVFTSESILSALYELRDFSFNETLALLAPVDADYYIRTSLSSCLFFDQQALAWSDRGCKVIDGNSLATTCGCNHLTSFGGGFIPMPNPIDFSYVFANAGFIDNITIYLTIIISFSAYIIGLIYTRQMDKKDLQKIGATPLEENNPDDHFVYEIMVYTGFQPNSGTQSKVSFLLVGDYEDSDVRSLEDKHRRLFRTGAQDHFVLTTPKNLGPLLYLRIWHDNSGKGNTCSWFLSHIVVKDLQTSEVFQFICNNWLAVEEGDGSIDRTIPVAGQEQIHDIGHVLGKKVQRAFQDDHLWFSVFLRPPRSRFSRVERLSSLVALVYLTMLANAMFYNVVPESSYSINMGFARIAPAALAVGFMSNLVVFLPSFLIVYFFRKSRPRHVKPSRVREALNKTKKEKEDNLEVLLGIVKDGRAINYDGIESADGLNDLKKDDFVPPSKPKLAFQEVTKRENSAISRISLEEKKKVKKKTLPWYFRIFAWILCVLSILVSVFFLWAYGIMFGNTKTTQWLTALLSGLFSSVLVTQPIKIYLTAAILSWICRRPLDMHDDYDDDEVDNEIDETLDYVHPLTPPKEGRPKSGRMVGSGMSPEALAAAKKRRRNQIAMNGLINDIAVYVVFITIIGTICYASTDPNIFLQNNHFKKQLHLPTDSDSVSFSEVRDTGGFYRWLEDVFVPFLYNRTLYNDSEDPDNIKSRPNALSDRVSFVLGFPILRQIRAAKGNCEVHPTMMNISGSCVGVADFDSEEKNHFGVDWTENTTRHRYFRFHSSVSIHGIPFNGNMGKYGGGGYIVPLRHPQEKALKVSSSLRDFNWIDTYTRAVFVEVSLYNPQVNLFGVMLLLAEFVPGGGVHTTFKYQGLNLLRYHGGGGMGLLVCELLFVVFILFFTRREYRLFKKDRRKYFSVPWSYLEIMVIALSYLAILLYLVKTAYTYWLLDILTKNKGRRNIRMQSLGSFDKILLQVFALLMFVATLKMLRLLRFNKRIRYLGATLKLAGPDIVGFLFVLVISIFSFVSFFHLIARSTSQDFSTFVKTLETAFFIIDQKFSDVCKDHQIIGPMAYFAYAFIMFFIVFPYLVAIICSAFTTIKSDLSKQTNDYEVVQYMMQVSSAVYKRIRPTYKVQQNDEVDEVKDNVDHIIKQLDGALEHLRNNQRAYQSPLI